MKIDGLEDDINGIIPTDLPEIKGRCKAAFEVHSAGGFYFLFEENGDWWVYFAPRCSNADLGFYPGEIVEVGNTNPTLQPFGSKEAAKAFIKGIKFIARR